MKPKPSERGAALLAVLLFVGVMGAIAALLLERTRTATQLVSNLLAREQAIGLWLIAESLAVQRIYSIVQTGDRATRGGGWQGQPITVLLPGGTASITPRDGGNCFNLGSLVMQTSPESLVTRPLAVAQFSNLMLTIDIPAPRAQNIAAAAADWIDSDDRPSPLGAEDSRYTSQRYRTAATLMFDTTELRAVTGVDAALFARLQPFVCALPVAELSPINPNTLLPAQAPLLAMLLPETMGPPLARLAMARRIIAARPAAGWGSVAEFANADLLRDAPLPFDVLQQLSVRTGWFRLALRLQSGDSRLAGTSLIDARRTPILVAQRRWQDDE